MSTLSPLKLAGRLAVVSLLVAIGLNWAMHNVWDDMYITNNALDRGARRLVPFLKLAPPIVWTLFFLTFFASEVVYLLILHVWQRQVSSQLFEPFTRDRRKNPDQALTTMILLTLYSALPMIVDLIRMNRSDIAAQIELTMLAMVINDSSSWFLTAAFPMFTVLGIWYFRRIWYLI